MLIILFVPLLNLAQPLIAIHSLMTLILLPNSLFSNSFNFGFFNTISLLIQDLFLLLCVGLPLCDLSLMIISRDFVDATSRQKQIFLLGISAIV